MRIRIDHSSVTSVPPPLPQTARLAFRRRRQPRGIALIYVGVIMVAMTMFVSMGVELGRVQLAKTQLQGASDAAARYGAMGLKNILVGQSSAFANAVNAAKENYVDGTPVVLDPTSDVQLVIWNSTNKSYTVTSDPDAANAVRVTALRTSARGNPIPLTFARILGVNSCDAKATSIAQIVAGEEQDYMVEATDNPFLSGMPANATASNNNPHNSKDTAGSVKNKGKAKKTGPEKQSPVDADITVVPNTTLSFDGVNGGANNDLNDPNRYTADGNTGWITNNSNGSENGISDMNAPINCLVGVFLDDNPPTTGATPPTLDFSTPASRDFSSLKPQLKQLFFIGDGRNSSGEAQQFSVPAGATRLFIATWDSYEWNNNVGSFSLTIHRSGTVKLVK